ncbi:unnamed protein product [Pedinophyceae sp. YPF-701]|nr:unnamed protein product [Pedinophyceae sp. YPF-701]
MPHVRQESPAAPAATTEDEVSGFFRDLAAEGLLGDDASPSAAPGAGGNAGAAPRANDTGVPADPGQGSDHEGRREGMAESPATSSERTSDSSGQGDQRVLGDLEGAPGWLEILEMSSSEVYFWHPDTNDVRWAPPEGGRPRPPLTEQQLAALAGGVGGGVLAKGYSSDPEVTVDAQGGQGGTGSGGNSPSARTRGADGGADGGKGAGGGAGGAGRGANGDGDAENLGVGDLLRTLQGLEGALAAGGDGSGAASPAAGSTPSPQRPGDVLSRVGDLATVRSLRRVLEVVNGALPRSAPGGSPDGVLARALVQHVRAGTEGVAAALAPERSRGQQSGSPAESSPGGASKQEAAAQYAALASPPRSDGAPPVTRGAAAPHDPAVERLYASAAAMYGYGGSYPGIPGYPALPPFPAQGMPNFPAQGSPLRTYPPVGSMTALGYQTSGPPSDGKAGVQEVVAASAPEGGQRGGGEAAPPAREVQNGAHRAHDAAPANGGAGADEARPPGGADGGASGAGGGRPARANGGTLRAPEATGAGGAERQLKRPREDADVNRPHSRSRHDLTNLSRGLPDGWLAMEDPGTGRVYYGNVETQAVTWERPQK